jgi:hypothetical protein
VPLMQILLALVVIDFLLWPVDLVPMQGAIKSIFGAVVVIAVVSWLLNIFGFIYSLSRIHVGA